MGCRARAGFKSVRRGCTAERQFQMRVWIDAAGYHEFAGGIDHLVRVDR